MPAITAFSDSIVLSFSSKSLNEYIKWNNCFITLMSIIQDFIHRLALHGILLRGGIAMGQLFHEDGVILGQGLIDAYELEQKAEYPRIMIADSIVKELSKEEKRLYVSIDGAGSNYLDISKIWVELTKGVQINKIKTAVDHEISAIQCSNSLDDKKKEHILNKWNWFLENVVLQVSNFA